MTHVVTERCVDCRYTDCCTVCPVDCFYETESPAMLVIDPDTCIDCELCVPECPIQAIWPEDELPDVYGEWTDKNADLFGGGTMIKTQKDALSGALSLVQIQTREQERGWQVKEPSGAGGEEGDAQSEPEPESESVPADQPPTPAPAGTQLAVPEGLTESQVSVFDATANTIYRWRTVRSVALQVSLPKGTVQADMDTLVELGHVKKRQPNTQGTVVYGAAARIAS